MLYFTSRSAIIFGRKHWRGSNKAVARAVFAVMTESVIWSIRNRNLEPFLLVVRGFRDGLTLDM